MATRPRPDRSLKPALEFLAARDPDVARAFETCGLPPVRRAPKGFPGLLRIIVGQQVSAQAARAINDRLAAAVTPMTPRAFLGLDDKALRTIGFSRPKMAYARALAEDVIAKRIDFRFVAKADDAAAMAHLIQAKGIGRWSAEVYLLFALRRPDIWPVDDLAVRVAAQRLKGLPERPDRALMEALGEAWRPYRSAAARLLWHAYRHPGLV